MLTAPGWVGYHWSFCKCLLQCTIDMKLVQFVQGRDLSTNFTRSL